MRKTSHNLTILMSAGASAGGVVAKRMFPDLLVFAGCVGTDLLGNSLAVYVRNY